MTHKLRPDSLARIEAELAALRARSDALHAEHEQLQRQLRAMEVKLPPEVSAHALGTAPPEQ